MNTVAVINGKRSATIPMNFGNIKVSIIIQIDQFDENYEIRHEILEPEKPIKFTIGADASDVEMKRSLTIVQVIRDREPKQAVKQSAPRRLPSKW